MTNILRGGAGATTAAKGRTLLAPPGRWSREPAVAAATTCQSMMPHGTIGMLWSLADANLTIVQTEGHGWQVVAAHPKSSGHELPVVVQSCGPVRAKCIDVCIDIRRSAAEDATNCGPEPFCSRPLAASIYPP
jgi:hypothetical protein